MIKAILSISLTMVILGHQISLNQVVFAAPLQTMIKHLEKRFTRQCKKKDQQKMKFCKVLKKRISTLKKKGASQQAKKNEFLNAEMLALQSLKTEVVKLTNQERSKLGLGPLQYSASLEAAAQAHTDDMQKRDYVSHDSPEGMTSHDRIVKQGYLVKYQACQCSKSFTLGENLAKGQVTPEEAVKGWMSSEGHRENILKPDYSEIGIGMTQMTEKNKGVLTPGSYFWAQNFGNVELKK